MSRQAYAEGLSYTDPTTGALKPASSVEISVFDAGTEDLATIYEARSGGKALSNPFVTISAMATFWADTGDYDIRFEDTEIPARFGSYVIGWQSSPVTTTIPEGELSDSGDLEWKQDKETGAWIPEIKDTVEDLLIPVGTVLATSLGSAPEGFLLGQGQEVSRSTYADLFEKYNEEGLPYGNGNGSSTFHMPDYRGRVLTGLGTHADVNALTDNDGLAVGSRTPKHTHTLSAHKHGVGTLDTGGPDGSVTVDAGSLLGVATNVHGHDLFGETASGGTGATGSSNSGYAIVNYIIKY